MKSVPAVALLIILPLAAAGVVQGQVMIVASQGPSASTYQEGVALRANSLVVLKDGDRLEVLDAQGSHVLIGPVSERVDEIDRASNKTLRTIFSRAPQRPDVMAVRGFRPQQQPPPAKLWQFKITPRHDIDGTGVNKFCVIEGHSPSLWRAWEASAGTLLVSSSLNGDSRKIAWPPGEHTLAWPPDLTMSSDVIYTLTLDDAKATRVKWRQLPKPGTGLAGLAQALLDNGCVDQLQMLKGQLPDP